MSGLLSMVLFETVNGFMILLPAVLYAVEAFAIRDLPKLITVLLAVFSLTLATIQMLDGALLAPTTAQENAMHPCVTVGEIYCLQNDPL